MFSGSLRRNPLLTTSGLMGLEFPAGGTKVNPSPYPPPRGGGWLVETEGPAPTPLSLPLKRGGGAQRRRGATRQQPPSVEYPTPKPRPLRHALPKGGGSLVSTHAALSPELGSSLKARSAASLERQRLGSRGPAEAPGSPLPALPQRGRQGGGDARARKVPPVGAGPDNPSGRMPENSKKGEPLHFHTPPNSSSLKAAAAWYPPTPHSALSYALA